MVCDPSATAGGNGGEAKGSEYVEAGVASATTPGVGCCVSGTDNSMDSDVELLCNDEESGRGGEKGWSS